MGSITDFLENELLDHCLNNSAYSPPSTCYLCLCTADPTDAALGNSMNEVANQYAYARTAITFAAAASRAVDQTGAVTFPQASGGGWGTVSHWAIASTNSYGSGDVLAHGAFATSKTINDGNTPSVASGEIDVTFSSGEISNYLANALLDFAFRNQAYSCPTTHVALCDSTIADGDTGASISEPSGGSYARKTVNPNAGAAPDWNLASSGSVDSSDEIAFTTATADWSTIVAVGICDNSGTGAGNLLFYDNDMSDQGVGNGDTAKFAANQLTITMS